MGMGSLPSLAQLVTRPANPLMEIIFNIKMHLYKSDDLLRCTTQFIMETTLYHYLICVMISFTKQNK